MRFLRKAKKKRRRPISLENPEELALYNAQLEVRYGYLSVKDMEDYLKMRRALLRLAKKHKKQADSWVV